jgi:hypothetical protein
VVGYAGGSAGGGSWGEGGIEPSKKKKKKKKETGGKRKKTMMMRYQVRLGANQLQSTPTNQSASPPINTLHLNTHHQYINPHPSRLRGLVTVATRPLHLQNALNG